MLYEPVKWNELNKKTLGTTSTEYSSKNVLVGQWPWYLWFIDLTTVYQNDFSMKENVWRVKDTYKNICLYAYQTMENDIFKALYKHIRKNEY